MKIVIIKSSDFVEAGISGAIERAQKGFNWENDQLKGRSWTNRKRREHAAKQSRCKKVHHAKSTRKV